ASSELASDRNAARRCAAWDSAEAIAYCVEPEEAAVRPSSVNLRSLTTVPHTVAPGLVNPRRARVNHSPAAVARQPSLEARRPCQLGRLPRHVEDDVAERRHLRVVGAALRPPRVAALQDDRDLEAREDHVIVDLVDREPAPARVPLAE